MGRPWYNGTMAVQVHGGDDEEDAVDGEILSQLQDPAEKEGDLAIAQSLQNWIVYHQGS